MKTKTFILLLAVLAGFQEFDLYSEDMVEKYRSFETEWTNWEPYISTAHSVLSRLDGEKPTFEVVKDLMMEGRHFIKYQLDDPHFFRVPTRTDELRVGDCKNKALWLAWKMNDPTIRFMIGKNRKKDKEFHAWLMWERSGQLFILDCTNSASPVIAGVYEGKDRYIPYFSYVGVKKFRHHSTLIKPRYVTK